MKILLIAGGWSTEREVSLTGGRVMEKALKSLGHEVTFCDLLENFDSILDLAGKHDFAMLNLHGTPGEDGLVQAMLESAKQMNFFTLARLAWTCLREVRTDLTLGDLNVLLPLAAGGGETNISMGRVPFDGAYEDATIDGMQVLRPDLERNRTLIRRFLSN